MQVVYGGQNSFTSILGTDLNYPDVKNIQPQEGRFFNEDELNAAEPVVVLGSKVRDELFGAGANPLSSDIRIQGNRYKVIGVMESKGSVGGTRSRTIECIFPSKICLRGLWGEIL